MTLIESSRAAAAGQSTAPLLEVDDLHVEFRSKHEVARAVNGVSYSLAEGETLAVLGESGSGKSVTAQAIMGILDMPPAVIPRGQIRFRGDNLLEMPERERRQIRGKRIAMIFQDALSSLNPVFTVGWQIAEMFRVHDGASRKEAKKKAIEMMDLVRIPAAADRYGDYPHQFSGGMRQRIMIAMAISLNPDVLIADEPTTALDVTVQAQVMELIAEIQQERQMGLILITHDLGVVADVADKIAVMYAGRIIESGPIRDIFRAPAHPYTEGLLASIPRVDQKGQELYAIKGMPPSLARIPTGCAFNPRCQYVQDVCRTDVPPDYRVDLTHTSACHFWEEVRDGTPV